MFIVLLSILDTEWPALLVAAILGILFVLIRSYQQNKE